MMTQSGITQFRKLERLDAKSRVLEQQLDHLYDRLGALERLLKDVRGWFSPYDATNKWCALCASELGDAHKSDCPYPKWDEEVTYLIGPK